MLASPTRYKDANGVRAGAEKVAVLLGRNPVAVVVLLRWARQATVVGLHCSKAQTVSVTSLTMVDVTLAAGTLLPSTSGAAPPRNRLQMVVQLILCPCEQQAGVCQVLVSSDLPAQCQVLKMQRWRTLLPSACEIQCQRMLYN